MQKKVDAWAVAVCSAWTVLWLAASLVVIFGSWSTLENLQAGIVTPAESSTPSAAASVTPSGSATLPVPRPTTSVTPSASASASPGATLAASPSASASAPPQQDIPIFVWHQRGSFDLGMLLLALAFGALGATAHALYVFRGAINDRDFAWSRLGWFLPQPPLGAVLGMLVFISVRATFVAGSVGAGPTNMFGVAAAAAVAGLSCRRAYERLIPKGDSTASSGPQLTGISPTSVKANQAQELTATGRNLDNAAFEINGNATDPAQRTSASATFPITAAEATGTQIVVALKDGKSAQVVRVIP